MDNRTEDRKEEPSTSQEFHSHISTFSKGKEKKKRKTQHCIYCQNHKKDVPKRSHVCPFRDCDCILCELLRKAQKTMRHQQRLWRYQKTRLQQSFDKIQDFTSIQGQLCDMCRNHGEIVLKKNHECPNLKCDCQFCKLTCRRRELMKHLQRVRRSKITTDLNEEEEEMTEESLEEEQDMTSDYIKEESSTENIYFSKDNETFVVSETIQISPRDHVLKTEDKVISSSFVPRNNSPPPLIPMEECHQLDNFNSENFHGYYSNSIYESSLDSPPSLCPIMDEDEPFVEESLNSLTNMKQSDYVAANQQLLSNYHSDTECTMAGCNFRDSVKYKRIRADTEMRKYNYNNYRKYEATFSASEIIWREYNQQDLSNNTPSDRNSTYPY